MSLASGIRQQMKRALPPSARRLLRSVVWTSQRHFSYPYHLAKDRLKIRRCRRELERLRRESPINFDRNREPLVSVRIATYNRGRTLVERAIASVLRQSYKNFEIVVIGDHCADDTEQRINALRDPRVRFYNLWERTRYPADPASRWQVAGALPMNHATQLARGEWIAPLDDDDEFSEDHLEVLVRACLENRWEFAYGKVEMEMEPGVWRLVGRYPPIHANICHLSVLYHANLRFFDLNVTAWKLDEPGDWNLWRRMKAAGVQMGFVDQVVGKHYLEQRHRFALLEPQL